MATITGKKLTIDGYTFDLSGVAPLASPSFTGTPTAPTAASGTNTTQIATTEFVQSAVASGGMTVDSAMSSTSTNTVQNKVIKEYVDSQLADLSDSVVLESTYDSATGEVTLTVGVMEDADNTEY